MKNILTLFISLVVVCAFSVSAHAGLINNGDTTYDNVTGLSWLDLNLTVGDSYDTAEAMAGYRHATGTEVVALYQSLGLILDSNYHTNSNAEMLKNLMGGFTGPNTWEFTGWADIGPGNARSHKLSIFGSNYKWDGYGSGNKATAYAGIGNFLVAAPVPEPGTVLLLGMGLVGFVGFRKKFTT